MALCQHCQKEVILIAALAQKLCALCGGKLNKRANRICRRCSTNYNTCECCESCIKSLITSIGCPICETELVPLDGSDNEFYCKEGCAI